MRRTIARLLRRLAQRLAPVPTADETQKLRDYYDNHDAVTGERIHRQAPGPVYNINCGDTEAALVHARRLWGNP